jgi:hypothetical protein
MKLIKFKSTLLFTLFSFFVISVLFISKFSGCANIRNGVTLTDDKKSEPLLLNVTYSTPVRDLEEEKKYTMEHVNYMKKVKRLEKKFTDDIDLLKMIVNVQNIQIDKLNEVIMVNEEIAKGMLGGRKVDTAMINHEN